MKRYYKATNGSVTVFRASDSRIYKSASTTRTGADNYYRPIQFSGAAASACLGGMPAEEITKAEYQALCALKVERIKAAGRDPRRDNTPSDSWVLNASLEG